jgi:thiol-disulfide isomerase/thioredoxin
MSSSWLRTSVVLVALLGIGVWLGAKALGPERLPDFYATGTPQPAPGANEFPSVSLDTFEGILDGMRGRPVVVNIWASWCAPCRTEMPLLQRAAETYAADVVILGVASNDDPAEARRFRDEFGLTYPNVFDATGEIRVALEVSAYPTTYVFDAEGVLQARVNGGISEQRLAGLIEEAAG